MTFLICYNKHMSNLNPEQLANESHRLVLTAIIYNADGKFLITKRSEHKKKWPGKWTVPGGGLQVADWVNQAETFEGQHYESTEAALHREVKEESGLEIERPQYLLSITFFRDSEGNEPVATLSYYAKLKGGTIKYDEDTVDSAWVSFEEAKNYDLIEGILGELEMVDRIINRQENPATVNYRAETEKLKQPKM